MGNHGHSYELFTQDSTEIELVCLSCSLSCVVMALPQNFGSLELITSLIKPVFVLKLDVNFSIFG